MRIFKIIDKVIKKSLRKEKNHLSKNKIKHGSSVAIYQFSQIYSCLTLNRTLKLINNIIIEMLIKRILL